MTRRIAFQKSSILFLIVGVCFQLVSLSIDQIIIRKDIQIINLEKEEIFAEGAWRLARFNVGSLDTIQNHLWAETNNWGNNYHYVRLSEDEKSAHFTHLLEISEKIAKSVVTPSAIKSKFSPDIGSEPFSIPGRMAAMQALDSFEKQWNMMFEVIKEFDKQKSYIVEWGATAVNSFSEANEARLSIQKTRHRLLIVGIVFQVLATLMLAFFLKTQFHSGSKRESSPN